MVKTTLYLPDELKAEIARLAGEGNRSEASVIREALAEKVAREARPRPTVPLFPEGLGDSTIAERVDELLEGFGR